MARATADELLVWIDLEMTGLEPARHTIVEIACIVTDNDLTVVDDGIDLVVHADDAALAEMDDYVRTMHTRSGLLPAIQASELSLAASGEQVLAYLKQHVPTARTTPLCGNSIGTDRRFLAQYLPAIEDHLHYRSIDVSSFKELCRRWYPEEYRTRPDKAESHRALDDILESVAELRYYREAMLKPR